MYKPCTHTLYKYLKSLALNSDDVAIGSFIILMATFVFFEKTRNPCYIQCCFFIIPNLLVAQQVIALD